MLTQYHKTSTTTCPRLWSFHCI